MSWLPGAILLVLVIAGLIYSTRGNDPDGHGGWVPPSDGGFGT